MTASIAVQLHLADVLDTENVARSLKYTGGLENSGIVSLEQSIARHRQSWFRCHAQHERRRVWGIISAFHATSGIRRQRKW